ncbi:sulfate permease [Rickenella mellea]|uniref:Sulfate permease n=1 Tax=Rickenella mellea TaxID=50990 RepID=A0A4Y7QKM0_9AGAM|nr:sulfate permease [Rickenella mellea]
MASSTVDKVKESGKRVIGYPQENIPTITSREWINNLAFDPKQGVINYLRSLFPILKWITRYNFGWLSGDLIAGITVGIVLVPQSMSYAQIATLPTQFGLYSAFVGVFIYCFFATSKDVSIGPVAVMSLEVSKIIAAVDKAHPKKWAPQVIATALAFMCGFIVLGIGLLRIGFIVEFIPAPAVSGFMTGSALNIVAGQVPGLMGISGFDTRAVTYKVIINTLKGLPRTAKDAAFGLPALVALYSIRIFFDFLSRRYPHRARIFFFISLLRNGFVIIVLTIASWLYCRHRKNKSGNYPIKILKTVPRGFQNVGPPEINHELVSALAGHLPVATIILLLEHIAISKSFGRVNGYKIDPNQELIAIGVTNTVGSVFNAYPATGSFSRTALKSKCGVRTPIAGWFTGIVVIVALYGLTPAFFWIPTAGLSAVIIHAVADLVAKPAQVYAFWRVSPLEGIIWWATVLVMVFSTIENGIYTAIIASLVLLLLRVARPRGKFLGKVVVHVDSGEKESREVFVPLTHNTGPSVTHQGIQVTPPVPGVIVYRFEESFLYPNSSILNSAIVDYVKEHTKRGKDISLTRLGDRPWNDPGPRHGYSQAELDHEAGKPLLKAIVLDFSTVSHVDTTSIQALIDTRNEVERWADHGVEFHFANILSPWIRRALVAGGFGFGTPAASYHAEIASVVPQGDITEVQNKHDAYGTQNDPENALKHRAVGFNGSDSEGIVSPRTPFFHFDLVAAVKAAEEGAAKELPPTKESMSEEYIK